MKRDLCKLVFAVVLLVSSLQAQQITHPQAGQSTGTENETANSASNEIAQLFYDGHHAVVIAQVDQLMAAREMTLENVALIFLKAESEYRLGRTESAVHTYLSALAAVHALTNNVTERRFASAYLRLAQILRRCPDSC